MSKNITQQLQILPTAKAKQGKAIDLAKHQIALMQRRIVLVQRTTQLEPNSVKANI